MIKQTSCAVMAVLLMPGLSYPSRTMAEDWQGASVKEILVDASFHVSSLAKNVAASATRKGCRCAKVEGNVLDGYSVRLDGIPGPRYTEIATATPVFSDDGSSVAYAARRGIEWMWIINGKEQAAFRELTPTSFAFSGDGKRHAYIGIPGFRRTALVVDGKTIAEGDYDGVMPWDAAPLFSHDGSRFAYVEVKQSTQQMRVHLDGSAGPWHDFIAASTSPGFGAYLPENDATSMNSMNRAQPMIFNWCFSSNASRFAYAVGAGRRCRILVDGKQMAEHDSLGFDHLFSADGTQHGYVAFENKAPSIFVNTKKTMPLESILDWTLTFSPDGKHLAFAGVVNGVKGVWKDGNPAPCDLGIADLRNQHSLYFSPDSKRLAFAMKGADEKLHWVVDGKAGPGTDTAMGHAFSFSADSNHYAYALVESNPDKVILVIDGVKRATYESMACGPVFRDDGVLEFLAVKDKALFRMEVTGY